MRELTVREVREQYGGMLPADAILRPDDDERAAMAAAAAAAARRPPSAVVPPGGKPKPKGGHRRTRSERFAVLNSFVDFTLAELTGAEVKVWLILYRDTKANGLARTGQADIARRAGLTVRGAQKAIDRLTAKGVVRVVRRGRLNAGPSVYRVVPTPA